MKKLRDPEGPVSNLLERIDVLGDKLGPIPFQLPPNWNFDPQRLDAFPELLPTGYKYAFEFRDSSWFDARDYDALGKHGATFCIYDFDGRLSPKKVTSGLIYIRLHGPSGPYRGQHETDELARWVDSEAGL